MNGPTDDEIEMPDGVSVVICTYNGAQRLPQCLRALSGCTFARGGEVIVVDNNSTDDSAALAAAVWAKTDDAPVPVRIVKEAKQGLAWARCAGAQAAKYDVLIYCDDDNLLDPDYVSVASHLMRDPEVGAASGVARPVGQSDFPSWFYTFAKLYAVGYQVRRLEDLGEADYDMTPLKYACPWGAGLVVRRQDVLKVFECPNFPLLAGRKAAELSSGEDYEICHLIALRGKRLVFCPRLKLDHSIPANRLTLEYLSRLRAGMTQQAEVLKTYAALRGLSKRRSSSLILKGIWQLASNTLRGRGIHDQLFAISVGLNRKLALSEVQRKVLENYEYIRSVPQ